MSRIHKPRPSNQDGFALPAAIFALMVVAILVTAGFFLANQEHRIGQSSERTAEVFRMAESGLNTALALWNPSQGGIGVWSDDGPQVIMSDQEGDGEWSVTVTRVDDQLYFLESTATITEGGHLAGATRTVGHLARQGRLNIVEPNAAVTTQDQLMVRGSATLDGNDTNGRDGTWFMNPSGVCPSGSGGRPAVLMNEGANFETQGQGHDILSPPGVDPVMFDDDLTTDAMSVFDDDNWDALTSMATISRTANGPHSIRPVEDDGVCDRSEWTNWGSPKEHTGQLRDASLACQDYFPVIHITTPGSSTFQINANSTGQGILLVDGNLHLNGNFDWAGPIYVRGEFSNNGGTGVYGGVVSRGAEINQDTDQTVSGNAEVTYSSCAISRAVLGASGSLPLRPVANRAWADLSASAF